MTNRIDRAGGSGVLPDRAAPRPHENSRLAYQNISESFASAR